MKNNIKKINIIRKELIGYHKPVNTLNEIKGWYKSIIKKSNIKIKTIPLNKCKKWKLDKKGMIAHTSGSFFKIEGVRVLKTFNRETNIPWDQPMFTEPGFDGGILGLIRKKIKRTPHYLINAKFEPGNYNFIQLSPTVQATFSNINRAHGGRNVKFLNFFRSPKKYKCQIFFKQWVSEEGGRLKNKRNLAILLNMPENIKIDLGDDYIWVTLRQIKELIWENAIINPHLRTLVSYI